MRVGIREVFFALYLVANLAIITFSIWIWTVGKTSEAVFVGLWAPTLNLLYVMFVITFKPFDRPATQAFTEHRDDEARFTPVPASGR